LLVRGDRAGAREALVRIVEEHPYPHGQRWDDALVSLADLAQEEGDHRAAIGWLERIVAVHEDTDRPGSYTLPSMPEAQIRIARIYRDDVGDLDAAAREFQLTYDEYPTSTVRDDALVELAEMLLEAGDRDRACELFADAVAEFEVGRARRRAAEALATRCR
jgi:TolA-binding protein